MKRLPLENLRSVERLRKYVRPIRKLRNSKMDSTQLAEKRPHVTHTSSSEESPILCEEGVNPDLLTSAGGSAYESVKSCAALIQNEQQTFLDQNCNEYGNEHLEVNWEEEDDIYAKGTWSPETETYWTLQYSDLSKIAERLEDGDRDDNHSRDAVHVLVEEDGGDGKTQVPKKSSGQFNEAQQPNPPPPPPRSRLLRYVTFWVCSTAPQPVVAAYDNPVVRAAFTAKVLLLKTMELILQVAGVIGMEWSPQMHRLHQISAFVVYTALASYLIVLISLKANLIGQTRTGAAVCILVKVLCLTEICAAIAANSNPLVVLNILMVLSFTYVVLAAFCAFLNLDIVNSNNILWLTFCLVMVTTVGFLLTLFYLSPSVAAYTVNRKLGSLFIPICFTSETVAFLTLSELFQLLQGFRIPLINANSDWVQATAQLF